MYFLPCQLSALFIAVITYVIIGKPLVNELPFFVNSFPKRVSSILVVRSVLPEAKCRRLRFGQFSKLIYRGNQTLDQHSFSPACQPLCKFS